MITITKEERLAELREELVDAVTNLDNAVKEIEDAKKWEQKMRFDYTAAFINYEAHK